MSACEFQRNEVRMIKSLKELNCIELCYKYYRVHLQSETHCKCRERSTNVFCIFWKKKIKGISGFQCTEDIPKTSAYFTVPSMVQVCPKNQCYMLKEKYVALFSWERWWFMNCWRISWNLCSLYTEKTPAYA